MNVRTIQLRVISILSRWVRPTSLVFHLTIGVTLTIAVGLAGMMLWSNWIFQQGVLKAYEQTIDTLTSSIVRNMAGDRSQNGVLGNPSESSADALKTFVERWSSPVTWLWLKQDNYQMIAKSEGMNALPPKMQSTLMSMQISPSQVMRYSDDKQHFLIKVEAVPMHRQSGQLFIAHDVTAFYVQWFTQAQQFVIVALLYTFVAVVALIFVVRRSFSPLKHIHRWISPAELTQPLPDYSAQLPDEVRELAASYRRLFQQVSETEEHQRQFTNQISHELRTPLSLIYGYLQSLSKRSTNLTHAQREALQVATEETENTIQILQDLLNTERVRSLIQPLHPEVLDLNLVINQVVRLATQLTHQTIQTTLTEQSILISSDRNCLTQLLLYLIEQIAYYTSDKQVIHIQVKQFEEVIITISILQDETLNQPLISLNQLKLSMAHSLAKKINTKVTISPNSNGDDFLQVVLRA